MAQAPAVLWFEFAGLVKSHVKLHSKQREELVLDRWLRQNRNLRRASKNITNKNLRNN
jgi:hypothetical protein